jgi:SAM-dependent methyltransferase
MKCAKRKLRIYEVPISYHGRTYEEGKKIGWWDGVKALGAILKFWLIDDLYAEPYGRGVLNTLTGTPQYLAWIAQVIRPHLGDSVLEIGAGIGNLSGRLMGRRLLYVAAEKDPLHLHALRNRFLRTPNVTVQPVDAECPEDYAFANCFDTVLCLHVLEDLHKPDVALASLYGALRPGGSLVALVPQGPALFGNLDRKLGHKRRYSRQQIVDLLERTGFSIQNIRHFNKSGVLPWLLYSRALGAGRIAKPVLKGFDKTVWLWRILDPILPWQGLSLIVVAQKPLSSASPAGSCSSMDEQQLKV